MSQENRFDPQTKLALHPNFSEFLEKGMTFPINIEISPSQLCQATCNWCFYAGTHGKKQEGNTMPMEMLEKLLFDASTMGVKAVTWTGGGEPTLNRRFGDMVNLANQYGIKQGLFTNALGRVNYDPSKLEWIRVSNTDKHWNIDNLRQIRKTANTLGLMVNYTGDDDVVVAALQLGEEVKADYVQIRPALNLKGLVTDRPIPKLEHPLLHITNYKFEDMSKGHAYSDCFGYHFVPFVWHNGDVDVCGYHPKSGRVEQGGYTLGNLNEEGLIEIYQKLPESVPVIKSCQVCCKNNEINKLTNKAKKTEDKDFV